MWADNRNGRCPGPVTAETLESYCQGYSVCVWANGCVEAQPVDMMWLEEQSDGGEEKKKVGLLMGKLLGQKSLEILKKKDTNSTFYD